MEIKMSSGLYLLSTALYGATVFMIADKSMWLGLIFFASATCFSAIAAKERKKEDRAADEQSEDKETEE